MSQLVRIVSDIHLGHRASVLEKPSDLRPLAEGADELIFNGDTLELKYGDMDTAHYNAAEQLARFTAEAATWGAKIRLVTGNHDPRISSDHFLQLRDGEILVTHGDGLFKSIAPWSSTAKTLLHFANQLGIDENATGSPADLDAYLQLHKRATILAHQQEGGYNPTLWGKLKIFLHQTWPPTTPFKIVKCWLDVPGKAVSLASRFRLKPRFIVVGHTHFPGIWQRGSQTIVNLGSYFPWPGARCIDIQNDTLVVRRIHKRQGQVRLGKAVARFDLAPAPARPQATIPVPKEAAR